MMNFLQAQLVSHPEMIFDNYSLNYTSRAMTYIIDEFERAADQKAVYTYVIDLLQATKVFYAATDPESTLIEIRKAMVDAHENANGILQKMQNKLVHAKAQLQELNKPDQAILQTTIDYVEGAIAQRMQVLPKDDPLTQAWDSSSLKMK